MGWTGMHREPGQSHRDFFGKEFGFDKPESKYELIDASSNGLVVYGALRSKEEGYVTALVILTSRGRGYHNFFYKEMDEGMGPCEDRCPERILNQLSPVEDCGYTGSSAEYAQAWRDRCRAYHADRKAKPKLKKGMTIKLDQPLNFTNGQTLDTFVFEGRGRIRNGYHYYRVNLKNYNFQVVDNG